MANDPSLLIPTPLSTLVLGEIPELAVGFAVVFFVIVSLLMMLVVLIQKPQGGGLSGAFGAGAPEGSGQTAFGAKTGDVLTTATIGIFVVFLGTAVGLNFMVGPPRASTDEAQVLPAESAPAAGAATPGDANEPGTFSSEFDEEPEGAESDANNDEQTP